MDLEDELDELLFIAPPIIGGFYICGYEPFDGCIVVCTNSNIHNGHYGLTMGVSHIGGKKLKGNYLDGNVMRRAFDPIDYDCTVEECDSMKLKGNRKFDKCICGKCDNKIKLK